MTLQWMKLKNFRGYSDFEMTLNPGINLLIGPNATGKTTILEALSVSLGSIFLGIRGYDSRNIRPEDTRINANATGESLGFERQYPVEVRTRGLVFDHEVEWARTLSGPTNRTSRKEALEIQRLAKEADEAVRSGKDILLPLIAYYGNGRLWLEPRDRGKTDGDGKQDELSRFMGYYLAIDPRTSPKELMKWIKRQEWISFKEKKEPTVFTVVKKAISSSIEDAVDISFDPKREELVLTFSDGHALPFGMLSDGQRGIAALVGDLGMRAARLNPHLGLAVLEKTSGVVLIDEVDLYLHPIWQRTILKNLGSTFPALQFICTTHSPQVIGEIEAERVIKLAGKPVSQAYGLDSNSVLTEVMGASASDPVIEKGFRRVYEHIDAGNLSAARTDLNSLITELKGSTAQTATAATIIENIQTLEGN